MAVPRLRPWVRSHRVRTPSPVGLDRLVTRGPPGVRPRRSQGSPRFLGGPPCVHALGWYPGGPPPPGHCGVGDVAFHAPHGVGSPLQSLEAGDHGLHTRCLRFAAAGYPAATQDSLPVGGQPLPGRTWTYWVHDEGFQVLSIAYAFLPSQASPGARGVSTFPRPNRPSGALNWALL